MLLEISGIMVPPSDGRQFRVTKGPVPEIQDEPSSRIDRSRGKGRVPRCQVVEIALRVGDCNGIIDVTIPRPTAVVFILVRSLRLVLRLVLGIKHVKQLVRGAIADPLAGFNGNS